MLNVNNEKQSHQIRLIGVYMALISQFCQTTKSTFKHGPPSQVVVPRCHPVLPFLSKCCECSINLEEEDCLTLLKKAGGETIEESTAQKLQILNPRGRL